MAGSKKKDQVTWAHATRDIVLRLIATGQLPIGIFGFVIILMVYKTPNDQIGVAWQTLRMLIEARSGLGYSLSVVVSICWFLHARFQRKNSENELRRVTQQRTVQQQKHFRKPLESSEE